MVRNPSSTFTRLFLLSLLLLLAVVGYSRASHPLVQGFGLAHARLLESSTPPILVVDNLPPDQASLVHAFSSAVIWGRSAFRVHEILLPWLLLVLATTVLSGLAPQGLSRMAVWWARSHGSGALPRPRFFLALLLGALTPRFEGSLELAFLPLAFGTLWVAGWLLTPRPRAERLTSAFVWLSAARWFLLGHLLSLASATLLSQGMPNELLGTGSQPTGASLLFCALAFIALHWGSRRPAQVDLSRYRGDRILLEQECNGLTVTTIGELWILLPAVCMLAIWHPLALSSIAYLGPYLGASAVCALLMKWTLAGDPPRSERWLGRLVGSLSRVITIVAILILPVFVVRDDFRLWELPTTTWLMLLALGAVRGRPWASRRTSRGSTSAETPLAPGPRTSRVKGTVRGIAALLATASLLLVWSSLDSFEDAARASAHPQESRLAAVRTQLTQLVGHGVRVLENDDKVLILGCSLSAAQWQLIDDVVVRSLPNANTASVSPQRWELAGVLLLGLTAMAALATLAGLLFFWSSESRLEGYRWFWALMGGFNASFALGTMLGWFWLDPTWHGAGWLLCIAMVWPAVFVGALRQTDDGKATAAPVLAPQPAARNVLVAKLDVLTLEIGPGLLPLVDPKEGAHLPTRVRALRGHLFKELGVVIPGVRFVDNLTLDPSGYRILVRGVEAAAGRLVTDRFLAVGPASKVGCLRGISTTDPTYGMPAVWIESEQRPQATDLGCMLFDPISVVATQLSETCRRHMRSLVTLETVDQMLEQLSEELPVTVKLVRESHSLAILRDIYRGLLAERVSIRDQESLLNALVGIEGTPEQLLAHCRVALGRAICVDASDSDRLLRVVVFDSASERDLLRTMGPSISWRGKLSEQLESCLEQGRDHCLGAGYQAVLLTHPRLRAALRESMSSENLCWTVLSRAEVPRDCSLEVLRVLKLQP